jgi:hypothetical protein
VTGPTDTRVVWEYSGGGLSTTANSFEFVAPARTGEYTITASSPTDPTAPNFTSKVTVVLDKVPPKVDLNVSPLGRGGPRRILRR